MKLLCVDASKGKGSEYFETWVEDQAVYHVRRLEGSLDGSGTRVLLKEIKNPPVKITALGAYAEPGFSLKRFVQIDDNFNVIKEFNTEAVPVYN